MILLWVSSMVVGVDIDARVYMGESSRSRNFRIKSYEKPYRSEWRSPCVLHRLKGGRGDVA
jgi:hypothetical protein